MTAALEGGEWPAARPGRTLPPWKTRYPFYRRLGGPQGRSGRAENLVPAGIPSRTVQPRSSVAIPTELPGPPWTFEYFSKKKIKKIQVSLKSRAVQPVVSRYTDWATRSTFNIWVFFEKNIKKIQVSLKSRAVQPVVSRYTDWATGPTLFNVPCCKREDLS